ncbi:MAG: TIGR03000 domain-containing protein [Gemmataceae bacterium]
MRESRIRGTVWAAILLAVVTGLLPATTAVAGSSEQSPLNWPWMKQPNTYGYDERPPATPPPANVTRAPLKYVITVTVLPRTSKMSAPPANMATVMARVPENALIWFNGEPTRQGGKLREFDSPPLEIGKKYSYNVRFVWFEDGQWVSETKDVPVAAGEMSCVYLTKSAAMTAALAELSPEDQKLAVEQRFCAVMPETPLGAMGPPVKLGIKGQAVFLCCEDCAEKARKDPVKTLAEVKALRAKHAGTAAK